MVTKEQLKLGAIFQDLYSCGMDVCLLECGPNFSDEPLLINSNKDEVLWQFGGALGNPLKIFSHLGMKQLPNDGMTTEEAINFLNNNGYELIGHLKVDYDYRK